MKSHNNEQLTCTLFYGSTATKLALFSYTVPKWVGCTSPRSKSNYTKVGTLKSS